MEKQLFENEFVPYEQALELKELGFDEPCFGWFTESYLRIGGVVENKHIQGENELLAPTFSQAFRWFREKHNFDLHWKPMAMLGMTCYFDIEIQHPKYIWEKLPKVSGKSYPEAELACLKKLIELAKNN